MDKGDDMTRTYDGALEKTGKSFFSKITSREKENRKVNNPRQNVQDLIDEIATLKKEIKEMGFLQGYNEKMLQGIIRNNEKLIDRYLSLSAGNASDIKNAIDEFKKNLSNMNEGLQQMTSVVTDLSESTNNQNDFCKNILDDIETVKGNNELSFSDIQKLNGSIKNLQDNSSTLNELVQSVEDVADKLRYMSFNGKIQAAFLEQFEKKMSTVKQGSVAGFSVVASQMESLSSGVSSLVDKQNSSTARIIDNIMSSVELSKLVEKFQLDNLNSVKDVATLIGRLHDELGIVAVSSEELSATSEEFSSSIEELYATIESISTNITLFYESLMKEAGLYRKIKEIAGEFQKMASRSKTLQEAAGRMMAFVRDEFINAGTGTSSIVMSRLFVTMPYKHLPAAYREKYFKEGVAPESVYLCLMGTAGDRPEWNDIRHSKKRQALLLPLKEEDFALMPMLARNFKLLGIKYDEIVNPVHGEDRSTIEGYALEKKVMGSPYVPDQAFVADNNIISQIGIGGVFPSGSIFTCFLFFNVPVDDDFAETFMIIPLALQMALKSFDLNKKYWDE
jgi:methyl-accepting chemotaxis protein